MYLKVHNLFDQYENLQLKSEISIGQLLHYTFSLAVKVHKFPQRTIKANKNIEVTIPFVQLPNHVCFQTIKIGTLSVHVSAQRNSMVSMKKISFTIIE